MDCVTIVLQVKTEGVSHMLKRQFLAHNAIDCDVESFEEASKEALGTDLWIMMETYSLEGWAPPGQR